MNKRSSTVTTRHTPLKEAAAAAGDGLVVRAESLEVETHERVELVDLTDRIREVVGRAQVREGTASLWSMHTTCSVFINESQAALQADIKGFLEKTVDRDADWLHNDPAHSDCDRLNADAHLRALMLGPSVTLQVSGGEIVLGQWQRVLVGELDGPRARSIRVMVVGIT